MELCMREKAVFFLPVNILTVWSPAFLAARHTTVCLDLIQNSQAVKKECGPEKGYGEKRCEIQGGGQEMAVMVG